MKSTARTTQVLIDELVRTTGAANAPIAIRSQARALIDRYVAQFGEPSMPINMDVLASMIGIRRSNDQPVHSDDAELVPDGAGGVTMRVNRDRPETRQRFSIAHEISHTFFPDYTTKEWCRTDARYRDRSNPDEHLEMLCDIGAAELLFPEPWFSRDAHDVTNAAGLVTLASTYHASREATLRRFSEVSATAAATVYFVWKLKPSQKATVGNESQPNLFGISAEDELKEALRLRIEYSIPSESFRADGHYLPPDKSIGNDGPIYQAAVTGEPADGECFLDLGQAAGTYAVMAIPLWTDDNQRGANGEYMVAAVLRPIAIKKPKRRKGQLPNQPTLF